MSVEALNGGLLYQRGSSRGHTTRTADSATARKRVTVVVHRWHEQAAQQQELREVEPERGIVPDADDFDFDDSPGPRSGWRIAVPCFDVIVMASLIIAAGLSIGLIVALAPVDSALICGTAGIAYLTMFNGWRSMISRSRTVWVKRRSRGRHRASRRAATPTTATPK